MSEQMGSGKVEKKESPDVVFWVAEKGLEPSIHDVMTDDEYRNEAVPTEANLKWYSVKVTSEADKKRWIDLRNEWLECSWTPNQDVETQTRNKKRMEQIEEELEKLEK